MANTSLLVGAGGINSNGGISINSTNSPSYFGGNVTTAGTLTVTSSVTSTTKIFNNGYTQLGEHARGVKVIYFTATTSASLSGETTVDISSYGIDPAKIVGVSGVVRWTFGNAWMPENTCSFGGSYCVVVYTNGTTVYIDNGSAASSVLGAKIIVKVEYIDTAL
jgi:hypothetical protein